jgi:hypothetical protein
LLIQDADLISSIKITDLLDAKYYIANKKINIITFGTREVNVMTFVYAL